jgi:anti-sigma factor RsiW
MTDCSDVRPRIDDYVDGSLGPPEMARLEEHLAGCPTCRAEVEAIRDLLADTSRLPKSMLPARDLWGGIEARLGAPAAAPAGGPPLRLRVHPLVMRIAAALGLVLLGAAIATAWHHQSAPTGFAAEQARYNAASAALAERLAHEPSTLSPATRAVVQRNLSILDAAIHEAESALAADPGNSALEQMLVARYEQRLALLRRAADSGRTES